MSILLSIILVAAIIAVALVVSYQVQKGQLPMSDLYKTIQDTQQDLQGVDKKVKKTSQQITPEVIEKAVKIAKATPESTTVTLEAIVEPTKPSKKRKYYPKATKGKA